MTTETTRRQIAQQAARLLRDGRETNLARAKMKAARHVTGRFRRKGTVPTNREVWEQINLLDEIDAGRGHRSQIQDQRLTALGLMQRLAAFAPRWIDCQGEPAEESTVCIELATDQFGDVVSTLAGADFAYHVDELRSDDARTITIHDAREISLIVRPEHHCSDRDGRTVDELATLLAHNGADLRAVVNGGEIDAPDARFAVFRQLLLALEEVRQHPAAHPEGDALYHSLQVFALAREALPLDEEFLLAALLHDVGKSIDRADHAAAGLAALGGYITPRTAWLIENERAAGSLTKGELGARSERRLRQNESFDELELLAACDARGRVSGAEVPDVDEALQYIRVLYDEFNE
jgi:hypothetical protein